MIGNVAIGGGAPIVVQSMTNTDTADVAATVAQVKALADAGSEIVRVTVNTTEAAAAVAEIRARLDALGCAVPLVGDFHFNGHKLLTESPACAIALAKYRINPGNVGKGSKRDPQFAVMIEHAIRHAKPVRIGVNWGSLDAALAQPIADVRHGGSGFLAIDRDAHHFRSGARQRRDLRDRAIDIGGVGVGHRLHDDRRTAADGDIADHDLGGFMPGAGAGDVVLRGFFGLVHGVSNIRFW